jgi:hypothetical protein
MTGKIEFGCDYEYTMLYLGFIGHHDADDPIPGVVIRLFLLNWGFSLDEADEAEKIFWERLTSNQLGPVFSNINQVIDRIVDYIKDDKAAKERFVTEITAVSYMDMVLKDEARAFINSFKDILDMKPSEFSDLFAKGVYIASSLNVFGKVYMQNRNPTIQKS